MKRRLIKFSNYSFCITLPKKAVGVLGWGKGDEIEVAFDAKKKKITISKGGETKNNPNSKTKSSARGQSKTKDGIQPIPKLRW